MPDITLRHAPDHSDSCFSNLPQLHTSAKSGGDTAEFCMHLLSLEMVC